MAEVKYTINVDAIDSATTDQVKMLLKLVLPRTVGTNGDLTSIVPNNSDDLRADFDAVKDIFYTTE